MSSVSVSRRVVEGLVDYTRQTRAYGVERNGRLDGGLRRRPHGGDDAGGVRPGFAHWQATVGDRHRSAEG